jgi:hypothetical protein
VHVLHAGFAEQVGGDRGGVPGVAGVVGEGADAGDAQQLEEGLDRLSRPLRGVIECAQFGLLIDPRTGLPAARLILETKRR